MFKVSFGIVFSNESSECANNFKSLLNCAKLLKSQIFVVFNAAKLDTQKWVLDCLKQHDDDLHVTVLHTNANSIGLARQLLIENTEEFIYMTDPDVEHDPDGLRFWLMRAFEIFDLHPQLAAVGGNNNYYSRDCILRQAFAKMPQHFLLNMNSLQFKHFASEQKTDHAPTCHVVFRKSAILSAGNFDPSFNRVGEDLDLSFRLVKERFQIKVLPGYNSRQLFNGHFGHWLNKCYIYGQAPVLVAYKNGQIIKSQRLRLIFIGLVLVSVALVYFNYIGFILIGYFLLISLIFKNIVVGFYGVCIHIAYFVGAVKAFCHMMVFKVIAEKAKAINIIKK